MTARETAGSGIDVAAPSTLVLLVDAASLAGDPELQYLLSFSGVGGIDVEHHIEIVEPPGDAPAAVVGAARTHFVSLSPLPQFRRFAAEIAARPGVDRGPVEIERALTLAHVGKLLNADAVVSPARAAFGPEDGGLLSVTPIISVAEALAMIGAHVRQRDRVPLGGTPLLVSSRTAVYPLTARVITRNGQNWWSACVRAPSAHGPRSEWLGYAEGVFKRVGQALRGRDGVHEVLRTGEGRAAILDALYHLDVVLTSSVGALDALAHVAHGLYTGTVTKLKAHQVAWQREEWMRHLRDAAPAVAGIVEPSSRPGAALRTLTSARNTIHGIPLDEYLHVGRRAEHRVMISGDLTTRVRSVGQPLEPLAALGLHDDGVGGLFVNVGEFVESVLWWTLEIVGALCTAMLETDALPAAAYQGADETPEHQLWLRQGAACAVLARVGAYPLRSGAQGLPAAPAVHRAVMASIHASRQQ